MPVQGSHTGTRLQLVNSTSKIAIKERWWLLNAIAWHLAACTPFDAKLDSWVGHPIQQWVATRSNGRERTEVTAGTDAAGNSTYVTFISSDCTVFWTVDPHGIMLRWRHEGSACKYYVQ